MHSRNYKRVLYKVYETYPYIRQEAIEIQECDICDIDDIGYNITQYRYEPDPIHHQEGETVEIHHRGYKNIEIAKKVLLKQESERHQKVLQFLLEN